MANEEQLSILRQGVDVWNKWRRENPTALINLAGADLRGAQLNRVDLSESRLARADLSAAFLNGSNLTGADLRGVALRESQLFGANLTRADLSKAYISGANLIEADLREAKLVSANLAGSDLRNADLSDANLISARLAGTDRRRASLEKADLREADLSNSNLVQAKISNANISKCHVYGVNVWDLGGTFKEQKDLIISRKGDPVITVDDVEVAQFVYLLLNNQKIRNVVDTVTIKTVLILGRFYEERKQVLDALREALRKRGFVPILFDFEPSKQRDLTETIQLLANMAKFVIADITDAKSIPQELSHIIPFLPSVPIQPILLISKEKEYAMFEHWRNFDTVLPEFLYLDKKDLLDNLEAKIIQPIDTWRKGQNEVSILQNRIKELEAKLSGSK